MRQSPTARKVYWLTIAFAATAITAITATGLLYPQHSNAAGTVSFFLDDASLASLPKESSIFLLADLAFPDDGRQTMVRRHDELHRLDYFQGGQRLAKEAADPRRPYCAILSNIAAGSFVEHVKRLEVNEVTPLPEGVRLRVSAIQESAIEELRCYSGTGRSPGPLTVGSLRTAIGPAPIRTSTVDEDDRVVLLAPPGLTLKAFAAAKAHPFTSAKRAPASFHYREALSVAPDEHVLKNLRNTHKAYLRYLETVKANKLSED